MGMNFFLQRKATDEEHAVLNKFHAKIPQLHIGKSSMGWEFLFHSPDGWDLEDFGIEDLEVKDIETWTELMDDPRFEIVDEEGKVTDTATLISFIMKKRGAKNHVTELLESGKEMDRRHVKEHCFLDHLGNPFCTNEFS